MKYYYIERINTQDGHRNGFYTQKAENLEKVLFAFDETESDGGLYAPRVAEITEAEYENFPYFFPKNWVYGTEEAEYTRDEENEDWEFFAGSNYYEREADNTPMSDKGKRSL